MKDTWKWQSNPEGSEWTRPWTVEAHKNKNLWTCAPGSKPQRIWSINVLKDIPHIHLLHNRVHCGDNRQGIRGDEGLVHEKNHGHRFRDAGMQKKASQNPMVTCKTPDTSRQAYRDIEGTKRSENGIHRQNNLTRELHRSRVRASWQTAHAEDIRDNRTPPIFQLRTHNHIVLAAQYHVHWSQQTRKKC